jgi:hypothetical protein
MDQHTSVLRQYAPAAMPVSISRDQGHDIDPPQVTSHPQVCSLTIDPEGDHQQRKRIQDIVYEEQMVSPTHTAVKALLSKDVPTDRIVGRKTYAPGWQNEALREHMVPGERA